MNCDTYGIVVKDYALLYLNIHQLLDLETISAKMSGSKVKLNPPSSV